MAYRRRRRTRRFTISRRFRGYIDAFLYLALGPAVVGLTTWISSQIPASNLTIGSVSISNTLFLNLIGWSVGIILVITGVRKLRIPI